MIRYDEKIYSIELISAAVRLREAFVLILEEIAETNRYTPTALKNVVVSATTENSRPTGTPTISRNAPKYAGN